MERRTFKNAELKRKVLRIATIGSVVLLVGILTMMFGRDGAFLGMSIIVVASAVEVVLLVRAILHVRCEQCSALLQRDRNGYRCEGCRVLWTTGIG